MQYTALLCVQYIMSNFILVGVRKLDTIYEANSTTRNEQNSTNAIYCITVCPVYHVQYYTGRRTKIGHNIWDRQYHKDGINRNILDEYMVLEQKDLELAKNTRTAEFDAPARKLYLAIWRSIGAKPKNKLLPHFESIAQDGPTLLWTLLTV